MRAQTFLVITCLSDFTYLALLKLGAVIVRAPRNDDLQILAKSVRLA